MSRAARRLGALLALLVLAGTGCRLDVVVQVDVTADGSGVVTVEAVADQALVEAEPAALDALVLDDARAAGWEVEGPRRQADGGAVVRLRKPFATPEQATRILRELNGPEGPLHGIEVTQRREFARTTTSLVGEASLGGGLEAFADQGLVDLAGEVPLADRLEAAGTSVGESLGLTVTVRAPGTASTAGGTVDGRSVTWEPDLTEGSTTELRASWVDRDKGAEQAAQWRDWTRWGLIGWGAFLVLAAVVALVLWLFRRLRRT